MEIQSDINNCTLLAVILSSMILILSFINALINGAKI